jgi:hypothetical protein
MPNCGPERRCGRGHVPSSNGPPRDPPGRTGHRPRVAPPRRRNRNRKGSSRLQSGPHERTRSPRGWVRTVRTKCLDWILLLGRRHLKRGSGPFCGLTKNEDQRARKHAAQRGQQQPGATAKTGLAHLALEDLQLVPKDHELDVAVELIGGVRRLKEQTTQQQVHEREEQGPNLP